MRLILFILCFLVIPLHSQSVSNLGRVVESCSEYIANHPEFAKKEYNSAFDIIDSVFLQAIKINSVTREDILFGLMFTFLPNRDFKFRIPILGYRFKYEVITVIDSIYKLKIANIPTRMFLDTPNDSFGDKDKFAHFFGAAFLSYSQFYFDLTKEIGYLVEVIEQIFKIDSSISNRDIKMNAIGSEFGKALKLNENVLPSTILKKYQKLGND